MHKNEYHTYINLQFNLWTKNKKKTLLLNDLHTQDLCKFQRKISKDKTSIIMLTHFYNVTKWLHLDLNQLLYRIRVRVPKHWPFSTPTDDLHLDLNTLLYCTLVTSILVLTYFITVPWRPASWPWHTSTLYLGDQHIDLDILLHCILVTSILTLTHSIHTWVTSILALIDFLNGVSSSLSSFSSLKWIQ